MKYWFGKKDVIGKFYIYILRCVGGDNIFYVGQTKRLIDRLFFHITGRGGKFTGSHLPYELVLLEVVESREQAEYREVYWRRMVKNKKYEFSLPLEFEDIFYRIMAMVSTKDLLAPLNMDFTIKEKCNSLILLPKVIAKKVHIEKDSDIPLDITIYKDGETFTFNSPDEIPAGLMDWINVQE